MRAPAKLALFAALLLVAAAAAAWVGGAVGSEVAVEKEETHGAADAAHGAADAAHGAADAEHGEAAPAGAALPGLAVAQDGYRLVLSDTTREPDARATVAFRVVDARGAAVREFDIAHEKRMHLIVVRRDGENFQHLHPELGQDGVWSATADLEPAGSYRIYADFTIDGRQRTLGGDVHVAGAFDPVPLPEPVTRTTDDRGLEVRLERDGGRVAFTVLRDGRPVDAELDPYLGAKGHLVTVRMGDLAYLHTHPEGDELAFETELPSAGTYRLWVQYQLDGEIHTAAFTQEVTS